jgi:microcystin-dependent protein
MWIASLTVVLAGGLMLGVVAAQQIPHSFTSGTPAKSSEVNDNFAYLLARSVPPGTVLPFAGPPSKIPAGYLPCDGVPVSRSTYSDLFAAIGESWGNGDNVSTFNVPDLRGRFMRGVDNGADNDLDADSRTPIATGGNAGDAVGSLQEDDLANHSHPVYPGGSGFALGANCCGILAGGYATGSNQFSFATVTGTQGGNETRPKNAYVNFIIKY